MNCYDYDYEYDNNYDYNNEKNFSLLPVLPG
jgi:hypothetical protein